MGYAEQGLYFLLFGPQPTAQIWMVPLENGISNPPLYIGATSEPIMKFLNGPGTTKSTNYNAMH